VQYDFSGSAVFQASSSTLLAIGLYAAVAGIDVREIRREWRTVLAAVTLGVVLKAAIIAAAAYFFGAPGAAVAIGLGIALAQIDPLSVAALSDGGHSRLSARGAALLRAWSSFDDPVTVLLMLLVAIPLLSHGIDGFDAASYVVGIGANVGLLAAAYVAHRLRVPALLVLITLTTTSVFFSLPLVAVACAGLFLRTPAIDRWVPSVIRGAFFLSVCMLGTFLRWDIWSVSFGAILGLATCVSQAVAALLLTVSGGFSTRDRVSLMIAQESGITAIILALVLEREFPGAALIIAVAVVTINLVYLVVNRLADGLRFGPDAS
jgi:hypothetical protein